MIHFSNRLPHHDETNHLVALLAKKHVTGEKILDLTISNPTQVGLPYPEAEILAAYTQAQGLRYEPHPQGLITAREAIAAYYRERNLSVSTDDLFITASTSESYHYLFKLLCNPGDGVLVPEPSYPLFEPLLALEGLSKIPYTMNTLDRAITDSPHPVKAIVLVNPNNPTGTYLSKTDWDNAVAVCKAYELAAIVDEVFWDYEFEPVSKRSAASIQDVLTFTLNGISKLCGLPQLKLGWIHVGGPHAEVAEAKARLEFISDCFLSAASPVQHALPKLLGLRLHDMILHRITSNLALIQQKLSDLVMPCQGGWSAVIRLPGTVSDEEFCKILLEEENIWIYPGYFFDFPEGEWIVASLLPNSSIFAEGTRRIFDRLQRLF